MGEAGEDLGTGLRPREELSQTEVLRPRVEAPPGPQGEHGVGRGPGLEAPEDVGVPPHLQEEPVGEVPLGKARLGEGEGP